MFDRGFLYGDSVYEVLRTYSGTPFESDAHLVRLEESAARIGMHIPVARQQLDQEMRQLHRQTGNEESYLRLICTRGAGEINLDPARAERPLRVIIAQPLVLPPPEVYRDGVKIGLVGVRRNLRTAIDPRAKTGNYLNSVLALAEAKKRGCFEAIMLDHRDCVTEGASSNIFAVYGEVLFTPPLDVGILKGITRTVIAEVATAAGLRVLELPLNEEALKRADEVFISSSIREIVPVVRVDEDVIGAGKPGPMYHRVRQLFSDYVTAYNRRQCL